MIEAGRNGASIAACLTLAALSGASCSAKISNAGNVDTGGKSGAPASGGSGDRSAGAGNTPQAGNLNAGAPGAAGAPSAGGGGSAGANTGGAGAANSSAGFENSDVGPLLLPMDGWVDRASNPLMIQGALFPDADSTSILNMASDFTGTKACIRGEAAMVDRNSQECRDQMFTPPAVDCFGQFWGVDITLNLNQALDPTTSMGGTPAPFDASALRGFAFELNGNNLPTPAHLQFHVESASTMFCNIPTKKLVLGANQLLFSDLVNGCFLSPTPTAPTAETAKSSLIKISWHVVTNSSEPVPYDFCVSNIRALLQ